MERSIQRSRWRELADDLAKVVSASCEPLTIVNGAGDSMSSGGPSTPAICDALSEPTQGRIEPDRLRDEIQRLGPELNTHLGPILTRGTPNFGYRLLAGLARRRRIYVINLCWDRYFQQACELQGVPHVTYDPNDLQRWEDVIGALPEGVGVVNCHVHGMLGGQIRFGRFETSEFSPNAREHVARMLEHNTMIVGSSLADFDVVAALTELDQSRTYGTPGAAPRWVFSREPPASPRAPVDSGWNVVDGGVDFDDIMQTLAEHDLIAQGVPEASWDALRDSRRHLQLPRSVELVRLEPALVRRALNNTAIGLFGAGFSAKSVTAWRIAHLKRLVAGVSAPIRGLKDLEDMVVETASTGIRDRAPIIVLDEPFGGKERFNDNPRLPARIVEICEHGYPHLVIVSRLNRWRTGAGSLLDDAPWATEETDPDSWFADADMSRLAGRIGADDLTRQRAEKGRFKTPAALIAAANGWPDTGAKARIHDLKEMLDSNPQLARLCGLVSLQALRPQGVRYEELAVLAGDPDTTPDASAFIYTYEFDGRRYAMFRHDDPADATVRWMNEGGLQSLLDMPASWVEDAARGWKQVHGPKAKVVAEWAGLALRQHTDEKTINDIVGLSFDQWTIADLALATVRLWPTLREMPAGRDLLDRLLLNRQAMGTHALLEACLYFGVDADDELWSRLAVTLEDLGRRPERALEAGLAVAALCRQDPNAEGNLAVRSWAGRFLSNLDQRRPEWALIRFLHGYYPEAFARLVSARVLLADSQMAWTAAQNDHATRLVGWHFQHQSRARALLSRSPHVDRERLARGIFPDTKGDEFFGPRLRLVASLAQRPPGMGWAFHLGCAMRSWTYLPTEEEGDEILRRALAKASPQDAGLVSGLLTYGSAFHFEKELRERVESTPELRDAILRATWDGVRIGRTDVRPPRFVFAQEATEVHRLLDPYWGRLRQAQISCDPVVLGENVRRAYADLEATFSPKQRKAAIHIVTEITAGDYGPLELAAARYDHGRADGQIVRALLRRAVEEREPSVQQEPML